MDAKPVSNLSVSVHQRLLNLSQARGEDPNIVLIQYAAERLLYRLSKAGLSDQFVLKGAMLFSVWISRPLRPTKDVDFLGYCEPSRENLRILFQRICEAEVEPDGLTFDPKSIQVTRIRGEEEYQGQRVKVLSLLGNARINLQVDIGFGDAIAQRPQEVEYPTLLDFPAPWILVYSRESVVA
jgi:hypothetical protein